MIHLAIDIGASSGRHIVAFKDESGKIEMKQIYRFYNGIENVNGTFVWNTDRLFSEIKIGMKKCREEGFIPDTMSVDTWGVDFVLLGKDGKKIGKSVAYRDQRTNGYPEKVLSIIPEKRLFEITGIKNNVFNTIFQLASLKDSFPEQLEDAEDFLMLPDYFVYLLTGKKFNEYTNASTTGLLDAAKCEWSDEVLDKLGIKKSIFHTISSPGTKAGKLLEYIKDEVGFDTEVFLAPSHDTASAVMAVPSNNENVMYISSGTWSLMGIESNVPLTDDFWRINQFTNEGGYDKRYRILKNIMGLWMIQNIKRELDDKFSFGELCDMAEKSSDFPSVVDALDECFLNPENMSVAVKDYCKRTNQQVPETVGELVAVVYNSLAKCYAECAAQIEQRTGRKFDAINIIGGGSQAVYLNKVTALSSGKKVLAGPAEATAIGNLVCQMIACGEFKSLSEARDAVKKSFDVTEYV